MNIKHHTALLLSSCLLFGCVYPIPWKREDYVGPVQPDAAVIPLRTDENSRFFVGDAFVQFVIFPSNSTTTSGGPPYRVSVAVRGDESIYYSVTVHRFEIFLEDELCESYELTDRSEKSLSIPFHSPRSGPTKTGLSSFITSPIDFSHETTSFVDVKLDIEVFSGDESERSVLEYHFLPKVRKGLWQMTEV